MANPKTQKRYDVIIVGSGAAGGMSAYVLAHHGIKVLMLEAGRDYDPVKETPMFQTPKDAPLRGAGTDDKPFGYYDATVDGGWQVPGEPYEGGPGTKADFWWWRARMLGGRTNHWGRISLRMGPYDFKPRSRDGLGIDWPMTYDDVSPYYDKTEKLVGIFGSREGLENTPDSPPGVLQPPPKMRGWELLVRKTCKPMGIPVVPIHKAILTQPINGRSKCLYATLCGRGCSVRANFQSTTVLLPPAQATGNLDIITDAMVREVNINKDGQATGVTFVDRTTLKDVEAKARVVILCASGCSSARILLNSKSNMFPDGLANSSGLVGRYLMDTVGAHVSGQVPALENVPAHNEEGVTSAHSYVPWWLYKEQLAGKLDFARGYHIEMGSGRMMPGMGSFHGLEHYTEGTYGKQFKKDARRYYGSFIGFSGRGEMIPNEDCYCEIDPSGKKDKYGIPVLKFHWKFSKHEINQAKHMVSTFKEIIDAMGGRVTGEKPIYPGGAIIHEVGTTCMGDDKTKSVLNQYCQSWDVPNLFVTDGGPFVSNADKNPTLSIMSIAWRACDYLASEMKKGTFG
ncbi:MAG: FAD-binding protein [Phycisphaera sp.]|nr:FAD-binding protein [Phycisphaera sp.]